MPISNINIKKQEDMDFPTVPSDMYECLIKDAEEKTQKKYNSDEEETVIQFRFEIVEGKHSGNTLVKRIRPLINTGFEGGQPSNLYVLINAVLGDVPSDVKVGTINDLIGKKVRCAVKELPRKNGDGKYNKIDDFYPVREKDEDNMPLPEDDTGEELGNVEDLPF